MEHEEQEQRICHYEEELVQAREELLALQEESKKLQEKVQAAQEQLTPLQESVRDSFTQVSQVGFSKSCKTPQIEHGTQNTSGFCSFSVSHAFFPPSHRCSRR